MFAFFVLISKMFSLCFSQQSANAIWILLNASQRKHTFLRSTAHVLLNRIVTVSFNGFVETQASRCRPTHRLNSWIENIPFRKMPRTSNLWQIAIEISINFDMNVFANASFRSFSGLNFKIHRRFLSLPEWTTQVWIFLPPKTEKEISCFFFFFAVVIFDDSIQKKITDIKYTLSRRFFIRSKCRWKKKCNIFSVACWKLDVCSVSSRGLAK